MPAPPSRMHIRSEREDDRSSIRRVITDAFGQQAEADLVDHLRADGDLAISLIAEQDDEVVGHIALSRLKSPDGALALAPLCVAPSRQRCGIGSALVRQAIEEARRCQSGIVFVLGDPDYYTRFGFSAVVAARFACRFSGPNFMALLPGDGNIASGPVVYPDAFSSLE
ncbi:MAG: GNAT family N-acetyltransferase [Aestuariivirgaceae bacterium]